MRRLDRRVPFFLVAAAAAFALRLVLLDSEAPVVKNVPIVVGVAYLVFALLFQLDWRSRQHDADRR